MADPEVRIMANSADPSDDVVMQGGNEGGDSLEVSEAAAAEQALESINDESSLQDEKPVDQTPTFLDYLRSPMVNITIGVPPNETNLTAHEFLLSRSPYFASLLSQQSSTGLGKHISLPDEDLTALTSALEYLYTNEYTPHKPTSPLAHVSGPTDTDGSLLLHHARIYTLASTLSLPNLKTLAHSKIHHIASTATAELAYARYVYRHTSREDVTIRKPVASFWGQRSHVLRHETEGGFRQMCLEFPEFAFDVLSFVLDAEEKRERKEGRASLGGEDGHKGSARKRARAER